MQQLVLYQSITLVCVVLVIDTWERRRPGHRVDKRTHLWLDVFAIGVVIVFGEFSKVLVNGIIDFVGIGRGSPYVAPLTHLPVPLKILGAIATADLALYWVHRLMHDSNLLWNTHRFHHSITDLYWLSGARTSMTHLFLFALTQMAVLHGVAGLTPGEATATFSFGVAVNIWVHANVHVDLGPVQWLIITPDYHRVHHAADGRSRRNLGFVFTIWDRIFGTYLDPRSVTDDFELGSAEPDKGWPRQIIGV